MIKWIWLLFTCAISSLLVAEEPQAYRWVIDDFALNRKFQNQMTSAIEKGSVTSYETIIEQLENEPTVAQSAPAIHSSKKKLNVEQRYNQLLKSSLQIGSVYKCDKCDQWHPSLAGGVMLTEDLAVTNYHVIDTTKTKVGGFGAMTDDGRVFPITEVVAASKNHDIAIVRLSGKNLPPPAKLGKLPVPGTEVWAMSRPASHSYSLTKGIIARYFMQSRKEEEGRKFPNRVVMQITADFARGSSGSGIFNAKGELIGLVAFTRTMSKEGNVQMIAKCCVPITEVRKLFVGDKLSKN